MKGAEGALGRFSEALRRGADLKFPGLYPGVYRVKISKQLGGKEIVPKRYNGESELGKEIAPDGPRGTIVFQLKSR